VQRNIQTEREDNLAAVTADSEDAPSRVHHIVVAFAFVLGLVLFLDRAALSMLAPAIRRDLNIGPMAMGGVFTAFIWGYALLHVPVGWLGDLWGARRVLTVIVALWSAFIAATAAAWSLSSLLAIRFLFGAAEAGATPNISQSFARWIPLEERARAQGFYFSGMSAGVALSPPLVTLGLLHWGWRLTFLALGALGVVWGILWFVWYRDNPADHRSVTPGELKLLCGAGPASEPVAVDWRRLLRSGNLWAILLMYLSYGYTGYIYITWFPSYLMDARRLTPALTGMLAMAPGVLGMLAKPLGGWMSDRLTATRGVAFGRRAVGMFGFGIAALAVVPGLYIENPYLAVFFLSLADGAAALAHGVCFAVCIDTGMKRAGTISGLMLTMGSLGGAASALAFGWFLQFTGSWTAPFLIGMVANATGALLWLKIDPKEQLV
jgi:MFS family permease